MTSSRSQYILESETGPVELQISYVSGVVALHWVFQDSHELIVGMTEKLAMDLLLELREALVDLKQ